MKLKEQLEGFNLLLTEIYDTEMRISLLLQNAELTEEQMKMLRQQNAEELLLAGLCFLRKLLTAKSGSTRLYEILAERYGLSDGVSKTLQQIR